MERRVWKLLDKEGAVGWRGQVKRYRGQNRRGVKHVEKSRMKHVRVPAGSTIHQDGAHRGQRLCGKRKERAVIGQLCQGYRTPMRRRPVGTWVGGSGTQKYGLRLNTDVGVILH